MTEEEYEFWIRNPLRDDIPPTVQWQLRAYEAEKNLFVRFNPHLRAEEDWDLYNNYVFPPDKPNTALKEGNIGAPQPPDDRAAPTDELYMRISEAISVLAVHVPATLDTLASRARQDHDAVEALASIAIAAIKALNGSPDWLVLPIARNHPTWPMAVGPNPADMEAIWERIKQLQVGLRCPYEVFRRNVGAEEVPQVKYAKALLITLLWNQQLYYERKSREEAGMSISWVGLPDWFLRLGSLNPFSTKAVSDWWNLAKEIFREACPKPEEHSDFKHIAPELNKQTAKRRARIVERVRQAFESFASRHKGRWPAEYVGDLWLALSTKAPAEESVTGASDLPAKPVRSKGKRKSAKALESSGEHSPKSKSVSGRPGGRKRTKPD